jgi:hypothetical protein
LRFEEMKKVSVIPGLFAGLVLLALPGMSPAGVFLSINIAPPALQVYAQPLCPTDGYLWQPGYWGYGNAGYYWIPGVWVAPPQSGFLWTPGYWGFSNGLYAFNAGYWGPTVGFYGGVNYGFGYGGSGFDGGRWESGHFAYNTAAMRVNTSVIHNTYVQKVSYSGNRTSFNGGAGGTTTRPSAAETTMARQHGQAAAAPAVQQKAVASGHTQARATSENHGQPANTAATRPATATNRGAETQSRMATRTAPSSAKPEARPAAATPRAAQQQTHAASPQAPRQVASRPAPQTTHAATPQRAAAPERAAAKPAEGKEERK